MLLICTRELCTLRKVFSYADAHNKNNDMANGHGLHKSVKIKKTGSDKALCLANNHVTAVNSEKLGK